MRTKQNIELPDPVLAVRGDFGDGVRALVEAKLASVVRHAHEPVLSVRVEVDRHPDPAVARPVAVKVGLDVNGHPLHASATARTLRDAIDVVVDRVVRQLDDRPFAHPHRRRRRPPPSTSD